MTHERGPIGNPSLKPSKGLNRREFLGAGLAGLVAACTSIGKGVREEPLNSQTAPENPSPAVVAADQVVPEQLDGALRGQRQLEEDIRSLQSQITSFEGRFPEVPDTEVIQGEAWKKKYGSGFVTPLMGMMQDLRGLISQKSRTNSDYTIRDIEIINPEGGSLINDDVGPVARWQSLRVTLADGEILSIPSDNQWREKLGALLLIQLNSELEVAKHQLKKLELEKGR